MDRYEVLTATGLAAVGTLAAVLARTGGEQVRLRHVPWAALRTVPGPVATEVGAVLRSAVLGRGGRLRESTTRVPGRDRQAVTRRALGALAVGWSPPTVWVEANPATGTVLLHELGAQEPGATERSVS